MKRAIDESNWLEGFIQDTNRLDVNESWVMFKNKLHQLRDQHVPQSKVVEPLWKSKGNVPISQQLRQLIKDKKRLHRRWIKSINNENEETDRQNYIRIRNDVKRLMTRTKRDYERKICTQTKENPKRFWKHIRGNLKTKTGVYPLLESATDETSLRTEDKDKAEILQKQFCRVFTKEPDGELPAFPPRTDREVEMNLNVDIVKKEILVININKAKIGNIDILSWAPSSRAIWVNQRGGCLVGRCCVNVNTTSPVPEWGIKRTRTSYAGPSSINSSTWELKRLPWIKSY